MGANTVRRHGRRTKIGALLGNNLFVRWMAVFAVIAACSIAMSSYLLFSYIARSAVESQLETQREAMERIGNHLKDRYEHAQSFMNNIYRNPSLANDMVQYLQLPFEEYMSHRLDRSFAFSMVTADKITELLKDMVRDRPDLQHIVLYSAVRQHMYLYSKNRNPQSFATNAARSYIPDVMAMETSPVSAPNIWIRNATQMDRKLIGMRVPVNDPQTMRNIGQVIFYFGTDTIDDILAGWQEKLRGYIVVLSLDGQVLYDSSNRYYDSPYPYMDILGGPSGRATLETDSYYTVAPNYTNGFIVAGIAPVKDVAAAYQRAKRMILVISMVCILIVVLLPSLYVVNFAKRTYQIIRFMRKAETGDLSARLPEDKEDELGQISRSFNKMMEDLSRHIERVYKAEIKQKQTELTALQARVQPHFLYNTLEVIRMRAVASGIHDVADMIYSLAMLFRNFVQPGHWTTLQEELENCRLYLELFRIRYRDHLAYSIECDPSLGRAVMLRMLIQPVIENYIVHGMRKDRQDNRIVIRAFRRDGDVIIEVRDNGKGIPEPKLKEIQAWLKRKEDGNRTFGLRCIHQRLELLYGPPYGITIDSNLEGTVVTMSLPYSESTAEFGAQRG